LATTHLKKQEFKKWQHDNMQYQSIRVPEAHHQNKNKTKSAEEK
jgi:hypothetical protein